MYSIKMYEMITCKHMFYLKFIACKVFKMKVKLQFLIALLLLSGIIKAQPNKVVNEPFKNILGTDTLVQQPILGGIFNKKVWTIHNKDKDTLEISEVKNGKLHGEQQLFYHNGNVKSIAHYNKGLLDGKVEVYIQNTKKLKAKMHYKALADSGVSVLHGELERYYHNKGIQERINYVDGAKNGKYTLYYQNGQIKEKGEFEDNLNVGYKVVYRNNGFLQSEENFIIIKNPKYTALENQ